MNLHCPACQTLYRVDPERIPASGVRTRCAAYRKLEIGSRAELPEALRQP